MPLPRQSRSLPNSARTAPPTRTANDTAAALAGLSLQRPQGSGPQSPAKAPGRPSKARAKTPRESSSTQRIVHAVRTAITERRLLPGTKLAEQQVADIFQVSRSIVRQALHQLERVGLVSLEPARGAFVRQPDATEAGELFAVRAMLEGNLAEHLAARLSEAQIASLRRHLADEAAAVERGDTESRTRLLTDFHRLLVNMAGNQVLAEVLGDLLSRSALIALTAQTPDAAEHSHEEHVQIVNALAAGDGVLTSRLMSEHLAHVGAALRPLPELGAVASAAASPSPALAL